MIPIAETDPPVHALSLGASLLRAAPRSYALLFFSANERLGWWLLAISMFAPDLGLAGLAGVCAAGGRGHRLARRTVAAAVLGGDVPGVRRDAVRAACAARHPRVRRPRDRIADQHARRVARVCGGRGDDVGPRFSARAGGRDVVRVQ